MNNWSEPELTDVNTTLHHKPLGFQIPYAEQESTSTPMYFNNAADREGILASITQELQGKDC